METVAADEGSLSRAGSPTIPAQPAGDRTGVVLPRPPRFGAARWLVLWLVVLGSGGYVGWRIAGAYRFYEDDLIQFGVSQESGLSWHLLGLNVFQHFGPINRLGHLFLVRVAGFSLGAGVGLSVVLACVLLASVLWLMHELGSSFRATLLSLVAIGLSITVLDTAVWTDASLHLLPVVAATNAVIAAHVRGVRTGHARWHVAAVLLLIGGILVQERALFALPLVVLVDWFVLAAGRPLRQRWRLVRSLVVPLAALTVVAFAAAAYIYLFYAGVAGAARPGLTTTLRTGLGAFTEGIGPPWLGLRLDGLSPLPVQLAILALQLVVAVLLVRRSRRNADALLLLVSSFLLYYGFLAFSPILDQWVIGQTALRLHNGIYLLVPTVVAVSRLRWRRPALVEGTGPRPGRPLWRDLVPAAVVATVLVATGGWFVDRTWTAEREAHAYEAEVARTEPIWSRAGVTLVPLLAPESIAFGWAQAYGRQEFFLRFLRPGWVPQELGSDPMVLDQTGRPRPVAFVRETTLAPTGPSTCGTAPRSLVTSDSAATSGPLFLRMTYQAETPVAVTATSTTPTAADMPVAPNWAVPLEAGTHTVVIPLHSHSVSGVLLDWTGGGRRCVEAADVVTVVYTEGAGCTAMDEYGRPTARVPCPVRGS